MGHVMTRTIVYEVKSDRIKESYCVLVLNIRIFSDYNFQHIDYEMFGIDAKNVELKYKRNEARAFIDSK